MIEHKFKENCNTTNNVIKSMNIFTYFIKKKKLFMLSVYNVLNFFFFFKRESKHVQIDFVMLNAKFST